MDTNDIDVIPPANYAVEAVALLAHVDAVEDEIGALIGDTERTLNGKLADRHNEIGAALKVADIYATLAVAEAIDNHRLALASRPGITFGVPL